MDHRAPFSFPGSRDSGCEAASERAVARTLPVDSEFRPAAQGFPGPARITRVQETA